MQYISSKENPSVKLFCKLCSDRRARLEAREFALEGQRLIEDALKENAELHHIFAAEGFMKKHGEALDFLPAGYADRAAMISDEVAAKMALTDKTQGVFAVCAMKKPLSADEAVCENGRFIMLHNIQDPGNMGTIIRTADAVGIDGILTVGCCDIYNPKVVRSTMGSLFRMNIADTDEKSAFAAFAAKGIKSYAAVVDSDALSLSDCKFPQGAAAVIGNEGNGLPAEVADACDVRLTIKMHGHINSLNAATASAIIMWELTK